MLANEVMELSSGYARTKKAQAETKKYRAMTVLEAKTLSYGDRVPFIDNSGQVRELKVNGKPQVWKTRPNEVRIVGKYGLYEHCVLNSLPDGTVERLLVPVEEGSECQIESETR